MPTITYQIPTVNSPNSTEDPKITDALTKLLALVNGGSSGGLDRSNLANSSGILTIAGTLAKRAVNFGTNYLAFNTSSVYSIGPGGSPGATSFSHGLGVVPVAIVTTMTYGDAVANVVGTADVNNFQVIGHSIVGATIASFAIPFSWIAIG